MNDPLAFWRRDLDPTPILADPHARPASTLMAVADKLNAVSNMLGTLNADHPEEREFGLAVANMAVRFAVAVLDHFGLADDDGPTPQIITLTMAQRVVGNLLAVVRGHVEAWQRAAHQEDEHIEGVSSLGGLVIDRGTFTVYYKGKSCELGYTKGFEVLERLSRSAGNAIHLDTLIQDVWKGKAVSDEAVQRQISIVRNALKDAGVEGIEFKADRDHYRLILR